MGSFIKGLIALIKGQNRALPVKTRQWLYDLLSYRAEMGNLNTSYDALIDIFKKRGKAGKKKAKILEYIKKNSAGKGRSFHDAIKPLVPESEYLIIAASEETGDLPAGLSKANERLDTKIKHQKAIGSVLASLTFRFVLILSLFLFLKSFLFDLFKKMLPIEEWPDLARTTYLLTDSLFYWLPFFGLFIFGLGYLLVWSLNNTKNGRFRNFAMDHLQPWNIHREIVAMSLLDSLGALTNAYSEKNTVVILHKSAQNRWIRSCLNIMKKRIEAGQGNMMANNPVLPTDLSDVLSSMGDGGSKKDFYDRSVIRLHQRIDEKLISLKKSIDIVGTMLLYFFLGIAVMSYLQVANSFSQ